MAADKQLGKILIVDDEEAIRFFIAENLVREGWEVSEADSGETASTLLTQAAYDIILLDLRLGDGNGLRIMRQIKQDQPDSKIIIMTAYASVDSVLEAMRSDVFDYLRKPCDMKTILDCINQAMAEKQALKPTSESAVPPTTQTGNLLDRTPISHGYVQTGKLVINIKARTVLVSNQYVPLTPTEYEILALLSQSLGEPLSVEHLIQKGLGYDPGDPQTLETLRVYISRLRRKIGDNYIITVRGGGYVLANIPTNYSNVDSETSNPYFP